MTPEELMEFALEQCRRGISLGQSPFGCAIERAGVVLVSAHNSVVLTTDITAHAEMNAIRGACREVGNIFLEGATVATTCEPCPMCMAALHWARVDTVYFGASIEDAQRAGFNELALPAEELLQRGGSSLKLKGGVRVADCRAMFDQWLARADRHPY